jgi:predicted phage-related endonuclease
VLTIEQKIQRLQGLGGSDIASLFYKELDKVYKTPYELWEEKCLGRIEGYDDLSAGNKQKIADIINARGVSK